MTTPTFAEFETRAHEQGEVVLSCDGRERTLSAGQPFELPRDTPHDERYGPEGATFWVARRS